MSGNVIQGPFYNSGFYDNGAGEFIEFLGNYYKVITINGKKWFSTNLKYTRNGWPASGQSSSNPIVNQLANRNYWEMTKDCYFVGNYFNLQALVQLINNELLDSEWHIPSVQEWKDLFDSVPRKELRRAEWWSRPGTNEKEFNLCPAGFQDGNSLNGTGSNSYLWTSDNDGTNYKYVYCGIGSGSTEYGDYNFNDAVLGQHNKGFNIRLCK